jgi:hypothetical protein
MTLLGWRRTADGRIGRRVEVQRTPVRRALADRDARFTPRSRACNVDKRYLRKDRAIVRRGKTIGGVGTTGRSHSSRD